MRKKHTKIIILLLTLLITVAMLGMVACEDKERTEEPNEVDETVKPEKEMNFAQFMNKINAGLVGSEAKLGEMKEYRVDSEYTLYTREENLTVTYKAVYRENRRNGCYYIRVFDNLNHLERLNAYYDSADLYVTVRDLHYVIRDFGTLLLFDTFSSFTETIDIGELVYGELMQTYFSETTILSNVIGIKNLDYMKVDAKRENITISEVDLWPIIGPLNAQLASLTEQTGTSFDAISNHYLGFELSRLLSMSFGSINVQKIGFVSEEGLLNMTTVDVNGRMQDNTKYFIKGSYAYDEACTDIQEAKGISTAYKYEVVSPGQGSYDGKTELPNMRDSDFDFALDYDVNAVENSENEFTLRIFDQQSTAGDITATNKYDDIREIIGAYYKDELLYLNTTGAYDYIGTTIALNALRLPKIFFEGFNLSSIMSIVYSDMLQAINLITSPSDRVSSTPNKRLYESIMSSIDSDVEKQIIQITITEGLIKQIRRDDTDLAIVLGEMAGVDEEVIRQYVGNDFFEVLNIVISYNFGTKAVGIDIYKGTKLLMSTSVKKAEYVGINQPFDLNELNYTKFSEPEVVTVSYEIELNPYGAEKVDISKFFGAFIGDATGQNTPREITTSKYISVRGKMSEYYITDQQGKRKSITTMDMKFYIVDKGKQEDELLMTLTTNPANNEQMMVSFYGEVGSYDGKSGEINYLIEREKISEQLGTLTAGDNIFSEETGLSAFLSIYNSAEKNSKTYTDEGYFCVDLMVSDRKDPVFEMVGISDTNARIKCKIGFDTLDLSGVNTDKYYEPYVQQVEDVAVKSIYSNGSKWKETATVSIGGRKIELKTTYLKETIAIETGKTEYNPVAEVFGKPFEYSLHIINVSGTYKVKKINISNDILIIDPAFSKGLPKEIEVMYEGGESGMLECTIEDFSESRVTHDGYNLALLAGKTEGIEKNKLLIGENSIASIEREIYIAVINRRIKATTDASGNEMIYVSGGKQIPVIAQYEADPYTYAMTKKIRQDEGKEFNYLKEKININRDTLLFDNLYGYETIIDDKTGEEKEIPLYYDAQGYNWLYIEDADIEWTFSQEAFSYMGETRYATGIYGDKENGYAIEVAIKVEVRRKEVENVKIDNYEEGTYTIDYLKEETYNIPTTTGNGHTVTIILSDGTSRIISMTKPAVLSDEEYCEKYIYGQLLWEGVNEMNELSEQGTPGLFGEGINATNETTAQLGSDICDSTQTVKLTVIAPSRYISTTDMVNMSLVTKIEKDGTMGNPIPVQVTKAQFTKPTSANEPIKSFGINPYNKQAYLPETIWLYVPVTMDENGLKEWTEYPIEWLTTSKPTASAIGEELNIIKQNEDGKFVLAHPVTQETKLVVYGLVGAPSRKITVTMSLLNMASNIKSYELYLPNETVFDKNIAVSVDPYLSYYSELPNRYNAILGSGQTISGETDWYYGEYPIIRKGQYLNEVYDGMYRNNYYIFPKEGGQFSLKMTVSEGEVSNDLYLDVRVDSRDIYAKYETVSGSLNRVSDYVDIFAYGQAEGDVYNEEPTAGYTDINYYSANSSVFLKRIEELIKCNGIGVAGFAFEQTGLNNLYAKEVKWELTQLKAIAKALKKQSSAKSFELSGIVDRETVNELVVRIKVTLDSITSNLTEFSLYKSEDMLLKDVYTISNDYNSDGAISMGNGSEADKLVDVDFYRNEQYKKYFGVEKGYTDLDFENVIYFEIDKVFMLSTMASGVYTSPYAYFEYLFDNLELKFTSGKTIKATAKKELGLGGKTVAEFNASVLGLNEDTLFTDGTGTSVSYSFLVLEKLSEGSAIDRTLVIVEADKANASALQREDEIDALNEDLSELYPERFALPSTIEVVYEKADGTGAYTAKYGVEAWTPSISAYFGSLTPINSIEAKYINIIDGSSYGFSYVLPDMQQADNLVKTFYYTVEFRKKNIQKVNYDASALSAVYDIENGKIKIENSYAFLTYESQTKKYVFNQNAVPTVLGMYSTTGSYQAGLNDNYKVKWDFNVVKTVTEVDGKQVYEYSPVLFGEEIFAKGTKLADGTNPGVLIATYKFDSYYNKSHEHQTQTLELYLVIEPMEFYAIQSDTLKIIAGEMDGENEKLNTIEIDPYNDINGFNGNFILPSRLTVVFNGNKTYDFPNVRYMLADEKNNPMRDISNITYGEKGHKLNYEYTSNPSLLKLIMYIPGYSKELYTGIRIDIKFLKRTITDSQIPNSMYTEDDGKGNGGLYVYEKDTLGNIIYIDNEPKKKTYYAYANYNFEYDDGGVVKAETGKMPVYYIDPYNSASFAMPTSAMFEFADTAKGKYLEYNITGWQYYNVETGAYVDFVTIEEGDTPNEKTRFYQIAEEGGISFRGFYNSNKNSYKGGAYPLRGYISVGDESQYFEVVCVVLNRTLRTSALLKEEYTVSYDFADPISAMLQDIPAMLGADAFVNYDRYNDHFDADARRSVGAGTYIFTITDGHYSCEKDGKATNFAVVPELLWEEEYDTDGDGIPDINFDDFTLNGFTGVISGNLYNTDGYFKTLFDYYGLKVQYEYDKLMMALAWDAFFTADGSVSNAFSASARNAIANEQLLLEKESVYAVYNIMLRTTGTEEQINSNQALSEGNKEILNATLFDSVLQEMNREAQLAGKELYSINKEEDKREIVYRIFNDIKSEYETWKKGSGDKTSKIEIYITWDYKLVEYRKADVKESRRISDNQKYKAQHYYNIYYTEGTLNTEEKSRLKKEMDVLRDSLYININTDLWEEVYYNANSIQRLVMEEYRKKYIAYDNSKLGLSIACDFLKEEKEELTELATLGEGASADISIPVIKFDSLMVEGAETPIIRFNKFNFSSIDKEFTVRFELSYEEIYAKMLEEATNSAISSFRDANKEASLTQYAEIAVRAKVDEIAPKKYNSETGEYEIIEGFKYGTSEFGYDMWKTGNRKAAYAGFWNTLVTYRQDEAVKVIWANIGLSCYADFANEFIVSTTQLANAVEAFKLIKVPIMAEDILCDLEERYDFEYSAERRNAIKELAQYIKNNSKKIISIQEAYESIGLDGGYSMDNEYDLTDKMWERVINKFKTEVMLSIAEDKIKEIYENNIDRSNIIRELVEYITSEDIYLKKLNKIYEKTENDKRANLAEVLLLGNSPNTNIQNAVGEAGEGNRDFGYAMLFDFAYSSIVDILYEMIMATPMGESASATMEVFETAYEGNSRMKGIISYMSLVSSDIEVKEIANYYFEFLTAYAKGNNITSPYELLMQSPKASGYSAKQLEYFENGSLSKECLLYYATPEQKYETVLTSKSEELGMTTAEIGLALKRMTLYKVLYDNANSTDKHTMDKMETEAVKNYRISAMNILFNKVESMGNIANHLTKYYNDETDIDNNLAYYSFISMVENAEGKGIEEGNLYEKYKDEYILANEYRCSEALLAQLKAKYDESIKLASSDLTSVGYIAQNIYYDYFNEEGFATVTDISDDSLDENYLKTMLTEICQSKGIGGVDSEKAVAGYMKDTLLRAIVYYYDNIATDEQKAVVGEVSEMYIGVTVSGDVEKAYIISASNGKIVGNVGLTIYNDLIERKDLGGNAKAEIDASYYTVWLKTMLLSTNAYIENYSIDEMIGKTPFIGNKLRNENVIKELLGNDAIGEEAIKASEKIGAEVTRKTMRTNSLMSIGYNTAYTSTVTSSLSEEAILYAYGKMYDEKTERGSYRYREIFDKILENLVLKGTELDELIFTEAEKTELNRQLEVLYNAVNNGVKTIFEADLYDEIKFLTLSAEEFARKAYFYVTGTESKTPAVELFGEELNGLGGIVNDILNEYLLMGELEEGGRNARYLAKLEQWWNTDGKVEANTMYGHTGEIEREIISQIHNQSYYQTADLTSSLSLTASARKEIAYASMLTNIYLFLKDLEEEVSKMPADRFSAGNVSEYKAYIIQLMIEGDLMKNKAHSLSLAQAKLLEEANQLAYELTTRFTIITGKSVIKGTEMTIDDYLSCISEAIIRSNGVLASVNPEDTTEMRKALYQKYLIKAVNYVEYTSILGSVNYDKGADIKEKNPLNSYANAIYIEVTGKNMNGVSYVDGEDESAFGRLSFGRLLKDAGNDYAEAVALMSSNRTVSATDFVSEDHAKDGDRHVIYFDRTEWDAFLEESGEFATSAYYTNKNIFISNPYKTERNTDVSGGYGYTHSLKAMGFEYRLSDFTTIDLFFNADEENPYDTANANKLMLDALAPELPSYAYAIGYVTAGAGIEYGIQLGKVNISEYSDEFYKLVYKATEPVEDPAYTVTIEADSGYIYKKIGGIKVGYMDRDVRKIYLENKNYNEGRVKAETEGDYVNLFSIYDNSNLGATSGKNVIYIDPTNESLIIPEKQTYIMPGTIAVQCGQGNKVEFTEVEWDLSKVKYGLAGTGAAGLELRVNTYKYKDDNGDTRKISYNYKKNIVGMEVYDKETGALKESREYILSEDDMIDWNTVLKVGDQSLQSISAKDEDGAYELFGVVDNKGIADATASGYEINPYYPEYPTEIQLNLAEDNKIVKLKQSDWVPDLTKLNAIKRGDLTDDRYFNATIEYLGYEIKVKYYAMDISIPKGESFNAGTVYLVKGEGDVKTQFERNYGETYFNFATSEGKANWQKVPVALKNYNSISMSEEKPQTAEGIIGGTGIGEIEANATFIIQVVELKNFAMLNGEHNDYVEYDYYGVPADDNKKAKNVGEAPELMGENYWFIDGDGNQILFRAETSRFEYDFINKKVKVYATFDLDEESDVKLGFNAVGERKRELSFYMPMKTYERSEISEPEFNKDSTGKIWRWTDVPETSAMYTEAIYWPIGKEIKASDLPLAKDRVTDKEFSLVWNLSDLNINRANVAVPGEISADDGTVIYGYYMMKNGVWQSLSLTVYIEKIDITSAVIGFEKEDGTLNTATYIEKKYDAQYFTLPFDSEIESMKFLREDGKKDVLSPSNYVVEYCEEAEEEFREWSQSNKPINAGTYYIRIRLIEDDYNVFIQQNDGKLFTLVIKPYQIDMSKIYFVGEDTTTNTITQTYGETDIYLQVSGGLPSFKPANWFTAGEKEFLFGEYKKTYFSDAKAKSEVYRNIYSRVTNSMKAIMDDWYIEGRFALEESMGFDELVESEKDIKIKAWVYDSKFETELKITEIGVKITYHSDGELLQFAPTNCGNYSVRITLDESNTNYCALEGNEKNLVLKIEKNTNINYAIKDTSLIYNGGIQNPEISGLHKNGTVPYGVKVTYKYNIGNDILVVVVEGIKDEKGNVINKISIDSALTTVDNPSSGIKDAGAYICSISIDGGNNYIDGSINDVAVGISPANVYINLDTITMEYLSEVVSLSDYIRIYDMYGKLQSAGGLLGTDKLSNLGVIAVSTPVGKHYKVGTYYTFIEGIKSSNATNATYTEMTGLEITFNGETYTKLGLKGYDLEGSLYKDAEGNSAVIKLFGNYNIFVKNHDYDGVKASGIYKIEKEEGSDGVSTKEDFNEYIDKLKDNDTKIVYLAPIYDEEGNLDCYDEVTINSEVNLTIVGYKSNTNDNVIETKLKGIRILKGTVTIKIVSIEAGVGGQSYIYVGDNAGYVNIIDSEIIKVNSLAENVVGVSTTINYKQRVYLGGVKFEGLGLAVDLTGGELEMERCTLVKNYNGIKIRIADSSISIKGSVFSNNTGTAIISENDKITVRNNTFEYNRITLDLPSDSIRLNINNNNTYANNGDDEKYR